MLRGKESGSQVVVEGGSVFAHVCTLHLESCRKEMPDTSDTVARVRFDFKKEQVTTCCMLGPVLEDEALKKIARKGRTTRFAKKDASETQRCCSVAGKVGTLLLWGDCNQAC